LAWTLCLGNLAAVGYFIRVYAPRYLVLTIPLIWLVIGIRLAALAPATRRWGLLPLLLVVGFNVANLDGRFYPDMGPMRRNGLYERSLEYLADHRSNIEAARRLESQYAETPIVACRPYVHFFALPRLGYVSRPLAGYATNPFWWPQFRPPVAMFNDHPARLVMLNVSNAFSHAGLIRVPLPESDAKIIHRDNLRSPLVIYELDLDSQTSDAALDTWYLEHLWSEPDEVAVVTATRAALLRGAGRSDLAVKLLEVACQRDPQNRELQSLRQEHLHHWAQARQYAGREALRLGQLDVAWQELSAAVALAPDDASCHNDLGVALARRGELEAAVEQFRIAVTIQPDFAEAAANLRQLDRMLQGQRPEIP
jgi:tetratricopeptide (TPR) repeat protein